MTETTRRAFFRLAGKFTVLGLGVVSICSSLFLGCAEMDQITLPDIESMMKISHAVTRSFENFTPEQEYYIGRTVGGIILEKYRPYNNTKVNRYINVLGQTLAQASDLPETYGGYHFLVLDSDEINALAAPGGLIFITRGLLKCCRNEDAVAAVLAHEIGHVQLKHGLQAIKTSRVTSALTLIGIESTKAFGGEELADLTRTFEGSIMDITGTLINSGYSRTFESQADAAAVTILKRVGYDPNGLIDMLKVMENRLKPGGLDFAKTHPSPASRIENIQKIVGKYTEVKTPAVRQARFMAALGKL
jgi:predicted Zn-dependent protease